ncbi:MAG: hypothetical protein CM1200mP29_10190 [Verrucomicrobiota bacterium]|nr:MAG: hypothetical protein CM1200mP29_10190 [Verrucomicrobiota bacterium]
MDVVVLEAADHVNDGIDFTDMAQELVAEPFAGGGAFHQPCDINESTEAGIIPPSRKFSREPRVAHPARSRADLGSTVQNG